MKERCIGAAVFGRENAYDTAQDPIVRNAAIEVRKRLAQYYMDAEHASEPRIDLPIGSYVPVFTVESVAPQAEPSALAPAIVETQPIVLEPAPSGPVKAGREKWLLYAVGALIFVAATATWAWTMRRTPAAELEAFWDPMFRDAGKVQVCIGQPTRLFRFTGQRAEELSKQLAHPPRADQSKLQIDSSELAWVAPEFLYSRDSLAAFKVASWIQSRGRSAQIIPVAQTDYSRVRRAPMVAIGAFNNAWSMRVTSELRFVFDRRTGPGGVLYNCIVDRRNPDALDWKIPQPVTAGAMTQDYAIVTRVFDPSTERTVISAAGIEAFGTLAASEFVTEPEYLGAWIQSGPKEWRTQNLQVVLGTRIIDGTPGPPKVLATHVW